MEQFAPFASLVPLVVFIPLMGALFNLFLGKRMGEQLVGFVASLAAGTAFLIALTMAIGIARYGYAPTVITPPILTSWISIPSAGVEIPWQFRVDTLSLTMMMVVTGIGTLIHVYAIGYMHGDERFPRFFVYLNLFLAFMLILVTGNNFLMMFVGWEGVGLCSFLLIGFWFDKKRGEGWKNSDAARKAFIANRVGDFGILMAIFLIFWTFGTLDYYKSGEPAVTEHTTTQEAAPANETAPTQEHGGLSLISYTTTLEMPRRAEGDTYSGPLGVFGQTEEFLKDTSKTVQFGPISLPFTTVLTLITLFILLGATGKSAQIPLFVWLPDAMAGPTPVSALIHAATMVTAGIYLITRSNVMFHAAPLSSALVTIIGSATALMAGFIAVGQWDIKKVLAYSTVSQLGFMIAAVGLGGYAAGMFHLVTHAFFKALLFLGSGSVIHGVEHGHHIAHGQHGHSASEDAGAHDQHAGHHEEVEEEPFDPQDMRNMGGLAQRMPVTYWTYIIGTLALAGIFPLAGFWSKDEILGRAFTAGFVEGRLEGYIALLLLLAAAAFTAFYMWRQIKLVFHGKPRTEAAANAPESVPTMTIPLIVLAGLSVLGGMLNLPEALHSTGLPVDQLTVWLERSVQYARPGVFYIVLAIIALLLALGAMFLADRMYAVKPVTAKKRDRLEVNPSTRDLFRLANAKLYWDEFYFNNIVYPYQRAARWLANDLDWELWHNRFHEGFIRDGFNRSAQFLSQPVDRGAIDQGFLRIGSFAQWIGGQLRRIQTGYVSTYAFTMLLGVLLVMLLLLWPLFRQMLGQ